MRPLFGKTIYVGSSEAILKEGIILISDFIKAKEMPEEVVRFSNLSKLAQFAGIAPINLSSAGKGTDKVSTQGNRRVTGNYLFFSGTVYRMPEIKESNMDSAKSN